MFQFWQQRFIIGVIEGNSSYNMLHIVGPTLAHIFHSMCVADEYGCCNGSVLHLWTEPKPIPVTKAD